MNKLRGTFKSASDELKSYPRGYFLVSTPIIGLSVAFSGVISLPLVDSILLTGPFTFMKLKLQKVEKSFPPVGFCFFQISSTALTRTNMAVIPAIPPPATPPTIAPTFDGEDGEEEFVVGDGGGVAGFGGVVLVGVDGGLVGADIGGTGGAEVGDTTGVGVAGGDALGVVGGDALGVAGGDALVVEGSYMLTANRMP